MNSECGSKVENSKYYFGSWDPTCRCPPHCPNEGIPELRLFWTSDQRLPRYRAFKFHNVQFPVPCPRLAPRRLGGAAHGVCTVFALDLHLICTGSARCLHWICTGSARRLHGLRTGLQVVCIGSVSLRTGFPRGLHRVFLQGKAVNVTIFVRK